jgi:cell wall-associated NlpC family hydrolase
MAFGSEKRHPGSPLCAAQVRWLLAMLCAAMVFGCRQPEARRPRPIQPVPAKSRTPLPRLGFTIQAGAFAQVENAARFADTLRAEGLEAAYFPSAKLYKVRFGDFPTKEAARTKAEALRSAGIIQEFYIVRPEEPAPSRPEATDEAGLRQNLAETARRYLGVPYLFGGTTDKGFDCSGLVMAVYRLNGLRLPRSSREQYAEGSPVAKEELRKGDLVFFATGGSGRISHVGMYIGGGAFIHAPSHGRTICTDLLSEAYYRDRYVGARSYL